MSVIEDSRKVLQDFIAPELRAIDARLAALEKRFEEDQTRTEKRLENLEARMEKRFDSLDRRLDYVLTKLDYMADVQDIKVRLAKLETQAPRLNDPSSEAA